MAVTFGSTIRDAICELIRTNAAGALLELWTDTEFTGTKLASFTLGTPAFNAPSSGTITATSIAPVQALATGDAAAFRIMNGANLVLKGTAGGPGSGADWELETLNATILQNQTLTISAFSYTAPV